MENAESGILTIIHVDPPEKKCDSPRLEIAQCGRYVDSCFIHAEDKYEAERCILL